MNTKFTSYDENRLLADTLGATIGAAMGAGISVLIGIFFPDITSLVPWGLIGGSVVGVLFQELVLR